MWDGRGGLGKGPVPSHPPSPDQALLQDQVSLLRKRNLVWQSVSWDGRSLPYRGWCEDMEGPGWEGGALEMPVRAATCLLILNGP